MKIEFNNLAGFEEVADIEATVLSILDNVELELKKEAIISDKMEYKLSVALVDENEIRKLNFEYRKKDEATDILSFGYENNAEEIEGELILCPEVVWKNASSDGIDPMEEFSKNLVHGVLHVSGYEHGTEMFEIQNLIVEKIASLHKNEIE